MDYVADCIVGSMAGVLGMEDIERMGLIDLRDLRGSLVILAYCNNCLRLETSCMVLIIT